MTEKITPQMKQFLIEFIELLKKHRVEIEAIDRGCDYNFCADGIEFLQKGTWDNDGNIIIPRSCFTTRTKFIDNDFIDEVNKLEVE